MTCGTSVTATSIDVVAIVPFMAVTRRSIDKFGIPNKDNVTVCSHVVYAVTIIVSNIL